MDCLAVLHGDEPILGEHRFSPRTCGIAHFGDGVHRKRFPDGWTLVAGLAGGRRTSSVSISKPSQRVFVDALRRVVPRISGIVLRNPGRQVFSIHRSYLGLATKWNQHEMGVLSSGFDT